jgi:hypothetical protein
LAALRGQVPAADARETNDDVRQAPQLSARRGALTATLDYWDDPRDVYRLPLRSGDVVRLTATATGRDPVTLALWNPSTRSVVGVKNRSGRVAQASAPARQRLTYRVPKRSGGRYSLELRLAGPGAARYTVTWSRARA